VATKQGPSAVPSTNPFLALLDHAAEKIPRRLSALHQYMKMYYKSRVKNEFNRRFAVAATAYNNATKEQRESKVVLKPVALKIRNEVGMEFWEVEDDEIREEVLQAVEDIHAKDIEEREKALLIPQTPQQFHW
jgi:hypothetical protein